MYLHKLLTRDISHWTNKMLSHLHSHNTGWAKSISEKLTHYKLETHWDLIKAKTKGQWKKDVENAVEIINKEKLKNNCTKTTTNGINIKTKTKHTHQQISSENYKRQKTRPYYKEPN